MNKAACGFSTSSVDSSWTLVSDPSCGPPDSLSRGPVHILVLGDVMTSFFFLLRFRLSVYLRISRALPLLKVLLFRAFVPFHLLQILLLYLASHTTWHAPRPSRPDCHPGRERPENRRPAPADRRRLLQLRICSSFVTTAAHCFTRAYCPCHNIVSHTQRSPAQMATETAPRPGICMDSIVVPTGRILIREQLHHLHLQQSRLPDLRFPHLSWPAKTLRVAT